MPDFEVDARSSAATIFWVFFKLGLTSFGGPVAHLGYFREEFIVRRRWLSDETYADLVALCQFLPGPASSQVGIGIGLSRGGLRGALAAWTGFTLPSACAMILFAYGVTTLEHAGTDAGWLQGLKIAAVAVVAQAVWGMAQVLCPDRSRATLALLAAAVTLSWPTVWGQIMALLLGALAGLWFLGHAVDKPSEPHLFPVSHRQALTGNLLFLVLLFGLPLLATTTGNLVVAVFDSFYRSGSLVFGGGHVVLPLLQAEVVGPGWISKDLFLAGYGAAQAIPGPLFTFSAYLGTAMQTGPGGLIGGLLCLVAIFLPSFLLVVGVLPYWDRLRRRTQIRSALLGVNAVVVGLLLAAFFTPVWASGIHRTSDIIVALLAFGLLAFWKVPPWLVVIGCGVAGALLG